MSSQEQFLNREKILYQFGNGTDNYFVFPKKEQETQNSTGFKTLYKDNSGTDGSVSINAEERFPYQPQSMKIDFIIDKNDLFDLDYVKRVFWEGNRQIFFVYDRDKDGFIQFYFGFAKVTQAPIENPSQSETYGQTQKMYTVELTNNLSVMWKCTNELRYFDKDSIQTVINYDSGLYSYDTGGIVYDSGIVNALLELPSTIEERNNLFGEENSQTALVYNDRFIKQSSYEVKTDNLVINTTLIDNSVLAVLSSNKLVDSVLNNRKYIVSLTQLQENDTVTITNNSNSSGIKFTWLNATASPTEILYFSNRRRCYDTLGNLISFNDILIERELNDFLYFNPQRTQNAIIEQQADTISLQKNTSSNLTIKIEALNTYK